MSIDKLGASEVALTHLQQNPETARAAAARKAEAEAKPTQASDQVSLSGEARSLAAARQAVNEAPEIRENKVAAIKQRVEDGTYAVSPRVLATKILEHLNGQGS